MSLPQSKAQPSELPAAAVAPPKPAPSPTPSAAAPPVYSHGPMKIYGAEVWTNLDHRTAAVKLPDGEPQHFTSQPGEEPSAFQQAQGVAKDRWKAKQAADAEAQKNRVQDLIAKARSKGAK